MILNRLLKLSQVKFAKGLGILVTSIWNLSNMRQFREKMLSLKPLLLVRS